MRPIAAASLLLLCLPFARAQVDGVPKDLIEQRIEDAIEQLGDDADIDLTNLFEYLTDRYLDPIDLNHTDALELNKLLLLSDVQISALIQHIRRNGKLLSIYELQTIDSWDVRTIEIVRPFITVRETPGSTSASLKNILKRANHELMVRSFLNIEQRRGNMDRRSLFGKDYYYPNGNPLPDFDDPAVLDSLRANNRVYLGSPYKFYTRYRFRYRQNISMGITAEKDEGEEFFRGSQPQGYDFYSAHFFLREFGRLKALAVGDYQAQFGQGLTFWNGLGFGSKSSFTMNVKRNGIGLMPYTSVNENLFMRGVAATYEVMKNVELTGFYSNKGIDGNITSVPAGQDTTDTIEPELVFSSFQEDGFHRTQREVDRKRSVAERIIGGHLRYIRRAYSVGVTAAHTEFGGTLARNLQPYNQFEFQGRSNTTAGLDWNALYRNLTFFGEAAMSANGAVSWNAGLLAALDKRVSVSMVYRDYARDFQNLYSVAFGEGINPWNQRGLFTGLEIRPDRKWTINAFYDQWTHPWLRYLVDAPSNGSDWLAQVNWRPQRGTELYVRVRQRNRPRNTADDVERIRNVVEMDQTNYRFNASYKVSAAVSLRTRVETVDFKRGDAPLKHGFLIYQDIVHRPLSSPVELTLRFALFETDSYDARIYAYENDLIGVFSIPPYYGRGIRWYGMVRATPLRRVDLWVRYGAWIYQDQTVISSGLQEIPGNVRSDIKVQMRWRF
ncbi:MAG: hypothetical protein KIT10_14100 [Flavobacteriales bacterium]|nr:hypothetical protein [Flavobacteriales bacterium]